MFIGGGSGGGFGGELLFAVGAHVQEGTEIVCLLTFEASVCPENAVTYSVGHGGRRRSTSLLGFL